MQLKQQVRHQVVVGDQSVRIVAHIKQRDAAVVGHPAEIAQVNPCRGIQQGVAKENLAQRRGIGDKHIPA